MYQLSVLIPARNEMFLGVTIENVLENIEGETEIIVVLDGYDTPIPKIPTDPRLTVVKLHSAIGQRAATNLACKLSKAKYVMKLDAHCAMDKGFDVKMMAEMKDHYTMVPRMYNLHAFNWVCIGERKRSGKDFAIQDLTKKGCGFTMYQAPTPASCEKCGGNMERQLIWKPRWNRRSDFMRFDKDLRFQYWGSLEKREESQKDVAPTMSLLGACWMLTREKYWELDICDEGHGSWGQQGTEVACKTWLSGGELVTNKKTWFAHMFRTQGGDFGFPYPLSGSDVEKARQYSKKFWSNAKAWPKAKYDLQWLVNRFSPIPGWDFTKGIAYYTDNRLPEKLMETVQNNIKESIGEARLISVSLLPLKDFGENIHYKGERGYLTMFKQQLAALEALDTDIVYFCEHDTLYHPSHFDFIPPRKDVFYYNRNIWRMRLDDGFAIHFDAKQANVLVAYRELLVKHYRERVRRVEKEGYSPRMGFEPGSHNRAERVDDYKSEFFDSEYPCIDVRHGKNLSLTRWKKEDFRSQRSCPNWQETYNIPGWGETSEIIKTLK